MLEMDELSRLAKHPGVEVPMLLEWYSPPVNKQKIRLHTIKDLFLHIRIRLSRGGS